MTVKNHHSSTPSAATAQDLFMHYGKNLEDSDKGTVVHFPVKKCLVQHWHHTPVEGY